jgi:hypothetical protein
MLLVELPAKADYALPSVEDRLIVLANSVVVLSSSSSAVDRDKSLRFQSGKTTNTLPIDLMWLADRINSGSICFGVHREKMNEYLKQICKISKQPMLLEIVRCSNDNTYFIAGIWPYECDRVYDKACLEGFPLLNMNKDDVIRIGGPRQFESLLLRQSALNLAKLEKQN